MEQQNQVQQPVYNQPAQPVVQQPIPQPQPTQQVVYNQPMPQQVVQPVVQQTVQQPAQPQGSVLTKYYRQPKLSIKLPSNGLWYGSDVVELDENATVKVLPMTAMDTIRLNIPEVVADVEFKFELIKSCIPAVKQPEKLISIDVSSLMFAIHAATFGSWYKAESPCPHCTKKASTLSDEERDKLASEGLLSIKPQTFSVNTNAVIAQTVYAQTRDVIAEYQDLKIYIKPLEISVVDKLGTTNYYQEMMEKRITELTESMTPENEDTHKEIIKEIQKEVMNFNNKLFDYITELLVLSVDKIVVPVGPNGETTIVQSKDEIREFLNNAPQEVVDVIRNTRDSSFDPLGLPDTVKVQCKCCGGLVEVPVLNFDPTRFFDSAS